MVRRLRFGASKSPWPGIALPILGCFGGGSLYGWSGLLPAVQTAFAVASAATSMVFSFALASFTIGVLLGPLLLSRISPRFRLTCLAMMAAASLAIAGTASGFGVFVAAYGVGFGFSSGALYSYAVTHASSSAAPNIWVPVSVAAFGLGGMIFGPMYIWLTELGWSLLAVLPAFACLTCVAVAGLFIRSDLLETDLHQTKEAVFIRPNRVIFRLWTIFVTGSCTGLIVLGLASTFMAADAARQATAVLAAATGNTVGRLSATAIAARFGPASGIVGALSVTILALTGLLVVRDFGIVIALLFLIALSYGQVASQTPLFVSRHVPAETFASAFGWVFTGWGVAGMLGPWGGLDGFWRQPAACASPCLAASRFALLASCRSDGFQGLRSRKRIDKSIDKSNL